MYKSIREFGVAPDQSAADNTRRLQEAIDWASPRGAALFVEPSADPYPLAGGIALKTNVSLIGVHGPVGRGTRHPNRPRPVGSVLQIDDRERPLITVESATQIRGVQFWYPGQTLTDPAAIVEYPPTIQVSQAAAVYGVTLSCLTFYGEYLAMDFRSPAPHICEQILIEHCYGYPLGGEFVRIDRCYDVPRILHCHVNPANRRIVDGDYRRAVIDAVVGRKTFSYAIDHTDNAVMMDLFNFGVYGGAHLGADSYGQLTNFNFDCVAVGILKQGQSAKNRNWQIAQGSIIANTSERLEDVHPIVVEGMGHTAISNVEAFSGDNPVVTNHKLSQDFLLIRGEQKLSVSLFGCRMRNYAADHPITNLNPLAEVQAVACIDKDERPFSC